MRTMPVMTDDDYIDAEYTVLNPGGSETVDKPATFDRPILWFAHGLIRLGRWLEGPASVWIGFAIAIPVCWWLQRTVDHWLRVIWP